MADNFHLSARNLFQLPLASVPAAVWVLTGVLAAAVLFGLWKCLKFPLAFHKKEIRWLALLAILLLPCSYFAQFTPFQGSFTGYDGTQFPGVIFFLGLIPAFAALGFAGPLPALVLAAASALSQLLFFGQDISIILHYGVLTVLFSTLTRRTDLSGSGQSTQKPLINALLAFGLNLPILLVIRLIVLLSFGQNNLMLILEQFLLVSALLFPSVLLAGLVCQLLQGWLASEWNPMDYLTEWEIRSPIKQTIAQIERLALGRYERGLNFEVHSPGEAKLAKALEELRENLRLRNDIQSRLLSLDPSHYSREGYDLVLSSILRAALGRDASTARLILLSPGAGNAQVEMRLRLGQGDQTRVYAYLDAMILDKLGRQDQLILSDLKVDQYFGLSSGMPFPQSIAALRLKSEDVTQGILWVGFDQNHWFSQEDIRFYQQLAFRASAVLSAKEQYGKLQNEKLVLSAALEALATPVIVLDSAENVVFGNSSAWQLMETSGQQEIKSVPFHAAFPAYADNLANAEAGNVFIVQAKGREFEVEARQLDPLSGISGRLLVFNETSSQKRQNLQKNEFVTNISHDLRSPLSHMRGYLNLLENIGNLSEEQLKFIDRIKLSIEYMSRLVSKVLSLEMLDSNDSLKLTGFDVKEMIDEALALLELQATQRKVSIKTNYSGLKNPRISADRLLLHQAVFNLVENAIKYSPMGGEVLVSTVKDSAKLSITVQDHGKGIAPLDQPKLFTRFFHIEETNNIENIGQGLGLAIAKSVVDKHGGTIKVHSQLGEGSIFTIEIPVRKG
jgi:signal transduction histidine kinase